VGRWLPWYGVLFAVLVAFGWWIEAERATPGFVWYTVVDNHLLNVILARQFPDEDVPLGMGEFATVALLGAAPWVMPAAGCLWQLGRRRAWRNPAETPWVALGLWVIGVLGLAILVPFRLPHYGLPAYPAIALLAARGWRAGPRGSPARGEGRGRGDRAARAARRSGRARGAARECRGAALVQPAAGRRRRRSPQRAGLRRLDPGGAGRALADAAPATGL